MQAEHAAIRSNKKMPDSGEGRPAFQESAIKQKLNCALPFRYSLSLGFFRFRGLNGITEIPKNFSLSRRPSDVFQIVNLRSSI
jgi:hypothetical protein